MKLLDMRQYEELTGTTYKQQRTMRARGIGRWVKAGKKYYIALKEEDRSPGIPLDTKLEKLFGNQVVVMGSRQYLQVLETKDRPGLGLVVITQDENGSKSEWQQVITPSEEEGGASKLLRYRVDMQTDTDSYTAIVNAIDPEHAIRMAKAHCDGEPIPGTARLDQRSIT